MASPAAPVAPASVPTWVPIIALLLSLFTLGKTLYNDWKASRTKLLAKFDADYGTPLRLAIRGFEKGTLSSLRTYTLASGLAIDELKAEIGKERQKWLAEIYELSRLLEEVDSSESLINGPWLNDFNTRSDAAEARILAMTEDDIVNAQQIASLANSAREELVVAINEIRTAQRRESASYEKWGWRR